MVKPETTKETYKKDSTTTREEKIRDAADTQSGKIMRKHKK